MIFPEATNGPMIWIIVCVLDFPVKSISSARVLGTEQNSRIASSFVFFLGILRILSRPVIFYRYVGSADLATWAKWLIGINMVMAIRKQRGIMGLLITV